MQNIIQTSKSKIEYLIGDIKSTFPKAQRFYHKQGFNEFDKDCELLLRYFESPCGDVPSESVDCIWHSMILYTKRYFPWTRLHFNRIIHHVPSNDSCNYGQCGTSDCCKEG